jgi:hypothetical protein
MKPRLTIAALMALGFLGSSIAEAQYRRPDVERREVVSTAKVENWTPQAGAVGTVVSVNGSGFTRSMMVLVGGRKVRPIKMGSRVISFKVPANYGDGQIVMRQAGVPQDYDIGQFQVWADPKLNSFSPSSGAPGTRVELRGQNFKPDDLVMLGSQSLPIEKYASNSLIVTIPPSAVTGPFLIRNTRRVSYTSRQQFRVVAPAPYISSFSPSGGHPGTIVRITGGNYGADIRVAYGRNPIPVARTGQGWIEVIVPTNARRDASINISSPRGGSRTAANFSLEMPAVLSSYSPSWGTPGTRVTINGRNFHEGDTVTLGGIPCQTVQIRDRQIVVDVPSNAHTGSFVVRRGTQLVQSASEFNVFYSPVMTSVAPLEGPPGTRVVVRGEQLAGSRVFLGNLEIRPLLSQANQIHFAIPPRAQSGTLRISGRGGEANYDQPFEVWNFPGIKRLSPSRGSVGTDVTISGSMMSNATAIFLGDVEMPIVSRAQYDKIVVSVPARAVSGPISWTAYGRNTQTEQSFTVLRAPVLGSFTPLLGAAGSTVTIEGENFNNRTRARYGNQPARVLRWEANQLTIQIPPNARQSDYLSVQGEGNGASATAKFELLIAPTARSMSPSRGKPGTEITIFGSGFDMSTEVQVGNVAATVLRAPAGGSSITVTLPSLATGSYDVSVQSKGMRTVARRRFTVEGWGMVTEIRPSHAQVGQSIMLRGAGLTGARVFFGSVELPVIRSDRRGRKLWVTIPEGCAGSSALTVDDQGHRTASTSVLAIDEAPAAPPRVHDYRKNKGQKIKSRRR